MATFIEPQDEDFSQEQEQEVNQAPEPIEQVDNSEEIVNQEAVQEPEEPAVPDKYRGKSLEEIIRMHQEAEKLIGRQAQEVGEVRRLADELIKRQLDTKQQPEPNVAKEEDEEVDWFENPEKAVKKAVDKHPTVLEAKQTLAQIQQQQFVQKLQSQFPDFENTVADPEFAQWIQSSPVRLKLYAAADNFDFDSAAELLNTWKYVKPQPVQQTQVQAKAEVPAQVKADREKQMKAVAVDTGSTGNVSAKIYRRSDLIKLQLEDPDRYMELQPEIMAAYDEGRVR